MDNAIVPPTLKKRLKMVVNHLQSIPVQKHVMKSSTRCYEAFGTSLIFVANNIKRALWRRLIAKLLVAWL